MFNSLSATLKTLPFVAPGSFEEGMPARKTLTRLPDQGTFVLPLKQSFIKDARLMPGTTRLLSLIAGWIGNQDSWVITTTQGILGKHLTRSTRQIYRYLQDAMEEGYLLYSRTANRMGYITGIKIWINLLAIRRFTKGKKRQNATKQDQTLESDTNGKSVYKIPMDETFRAKIEEICQRNGIDPSPLPD